MDQSTLINIITVVASIATAFGVTKYRVDRLEKDKEKDAKDVQRIARDLATEIKALDTRIREHTGNLYEGLDDVRGAGGVLESRVSAIETTMQPDRVHEFNQRIGEDRARLNRAERDIQRVEDHLLDFIKERTK